MAGEATIAADCSLANYADKLFTDPGYVEAFKRLQAHQGAGCFGDAVNSTTPPAPRIQFINQQTAMYYQGTWIIGNLKDDGLEGQVRHVPHAAHDRHAAKGNQNFVLAGPVGSEVSSKTHYPDVAAEVPRLLCLAVQPGRHARE